MKSLYFAVATCLVLISSVAVRADSSARGSLETYYLNPQPAEVPSIIRSLADQGYLKKPERTAVAIGFLSVLFARHPERVDAWLLELNNVPLQLHRLIASALWQAGNPLGADLLRHLSQYTNPPNYAVERLADLPSLPVAVTPVLSTSSMNLQWGAFLATGEDTYVINILDAIGTDQPGLDAAARYSLAQEAAAHPRVFEICQSELAKRPAEVRSVVRAALNDAASATGRPSI